MGLDPIWNGRLEKEPLSPFGFFSRVRLVDRLALSPNIGPNAE